MKYLPLKPLIGLLAVTVSVAAAGNAPRPARLAYNGQAIAQQDSTGTTGKSQKSDAQKSDQVQDPRAAYVETMREAVKANPDSPEAHYRLGIALQSQNKTEEAIASFKQALKLKPDYPEAYNRLVQLYFGARRYDDAISIIKQKIAANPDDASAHQQLGQAYFNLHK